MSDPSRSVAEGSTPVLNRRALILTGVAGAATAYGLTASGASARSLSPLGSSAGSVSFGSNASDPVPKKAYAQVFSAFTKKTGTKVSVNTVDHNTFQDQINSYLQGRPQDVFTWFAGYRMQFFAQKKLLAPIDDVWKTLAPQFPPALQAASKGLDGHYYFVPIYNYPWAVFYRKSVFASKGYTVPTTLGRVHGAGQEDEGGRPDADRVHGQGRLARDGHVRHPEHAHQRLRLPHPADGAARSRGTARRSRPSSTSGPSSCRTTRPARSV